MPDSLQSPTGITRGQFDAVMRRAAELAARSTDGEPDEVALTDAEVIRIGKEVGLDERYVRSALSEVRTGPESHGFLDRLFGPTSVHAIRVLPGTPQALAAKLDAYFTDSLYFEALRRGPRILRYRPRQDVASKVGRFIRFGGKRSNLVSASSIDVTLDPSGSDPAAPDSTCLAIHAEPGSRGEYVGGAIALGSGLGMGLAGGGVVYAVLGLGIPLAFAMVGGATVVGGVLWLTARAFGAQYRRGLAELGLRLEGVFDRLEHGEPLETPRSPWRGRSRGRDRP